MYNGIGLQTPRGSGTNGYVQRNFAQLHESKQRVEYNAEEDIRKSESLLLRGPNEEILMHKRRRNIENKCLELQELMEDQGFSQSEIDEKVGEYRTLLTQQMEQTKFDEVITIEIDEYGRPVTKETHELALMQKKKNEHLRNVFEIAEDFVEGHSLERMTKNKEAKAEAEKVAIEVKKVEEAQKAKEVPKKPEKEKKVLTKKKKKFGGKIKKSQKKRKNDGPVLRLRVLLQVRLHLILQAQPRPQVLQQNFENRKKKRKN